MIKSMLKGRENFNFVEAYTNLVCWLILIMFSLPKKYFLRPDALTNQFPFIYA